METVIKEIIREFKTQGWHFITADTNTGKNVSLKFFVGDVQIFSIDGRHHNIGFNYGPKTKTRDAILKALN